MILDGIPWNSFKTFENGSKLFHLVQNCLGMICKIFGNVINLIGHNLEKTEFLTELRGNCSKMRTTNSKFLETTPYGLSVILVKFEDDRSDASPKMTQSGKHKIFRETSSGIFQKS